MRRKTNKMGDGSFIDAIIIAIRDLAQPKVSEVNPVPNHVRIDGKTCLITGANSGLGKVAAAELARRKHNFSLQTRSYENMRRNKETVWFRERRNDGSGPLGSSVGTPSLR